MEPKHYAPKQAIVTEGEDGSDFYIIQEVLYCILQYFSAFAGPFIFCCCFNILLDTYGHDRLARHICAIFEWRREMHLFRVVKEMIKGKWWIRCLRH